MTTAPASAGLYRAVMAAAFDDLPPAVRALHAGAGGTFHGVADVGGDRSLIATLLRRLLGLPLPQQDVAVEVTIVAGQAHERWTRCFAGHLFASTMRRANRPPYRLQERFGVLVFDFDLQVADGALSMLMRTWRLGPLPLPAVWMPRSTTHEFQDAQGRYCFDVSIRLPLVGLLTRYRGWLDVGAPAMAAISSERA